MSVAKSWVGLGWASANKEWWLGWNFVYHTNSRSKMILAVSEFFARLSFMVYQQSLPISGQTATAREKLATAKMFSIGSSIYLIKLRKRCSLAWCIRYGAVCTSLYRSYYNKRSGMILAVSEFSNGLSLMAYQNSQPISWRTVIASEILSNGKNVQFRKLYPQNDSKAGCSLEWCIIVWQNT